MLLADFWMPGAATLRLIAPELVLTAAIVALLLAPLIAGRVWQLSGVIAIAGAAMAALAATQGFGDVSRGAFELFSVPTTGPASADVLGPGVLVADRLSMFFRVLLMLFLLAIIGMWWMLDAPRERHAPEFLTLLLCSALGMAMMTSAVNLLLMIIAIELASLPSYALTAFDRFRRPAAEAGVKYVVFGAATTGFMVYGASLLYGLTGTLHVPTIVERLAAADLSASAAWLAALALLALFAGIGFKISAVPFHFWCPDVFEGASLPVATWLSVASKAAGLVLLLRIVFLMAGPDDVMYVQNVLPLVSYGVGAFAILTCSVANLAAYQQTSVRRLLAYSSIAHAGYMLGAGAIVFRAEDISAAATSALIAYLTIYLFMNLGAFMSLGLVAAETGREDIDAFTGLGWRDPPTALSLSICLFSLIGLPPLGGFIVKWWLIYAIGSSAAAEHAPMLWIVVIAIVINTVLSLFYYVRIVRQMYLRGFEGDDAGRVANAGGLRAPAAGTLLLHFCALVLMLTGTLLVPSLKRAADDAAAAMYSSAPPPAPVHVARR
jgi:NADH-quinone oxidoreductase subunit N